MVIVSENSDYGDIRVVARKDLVKKEDTWEYKQAQKRADELRLMTAKAEENFEKVTERVISAACKALASRIKMNVLFGSNMAGGGWAVTIAEELEKLIKEDGKETIKKEVGDDNL